MAQLKGFGAVPTYRGRPLLASFDEDSYRFYIEWLAEYLYRPKVGMKLLSLEAVRMIVVGVEIRITHRIWSQGEAKRLRSRAGGGHVDIPFRMRLSHALSHVPDLGQRIRELDWLYQEVNVDLTK